MYCPVCGVEIREGAKFCSTCGVAVPTTETSAEGKRSVASQGPKQRRVVLGAAMVAIAAAGVLGVLVVHPFPWDGEETASAGNMVGGNPAQTGEYPAPGPEGAPHLLWRFEMHDPIVCAVVEGVVYAADGTGGIHALDIATGTERWRVQLGFDELARCPAVADGVVYVGHRHLYALEAATGRERWRFRVGDNFGVSSAVVTAGVVYVGSLDGNVYALDAATGAERWRFQTGDWVGPPPAIADGVAFVASWDGYVYALDAATGAEHWRFRAGYGGRAVVTRDVVYTAGYEAAADEDHVDLVDVYALDAASGGQRWRIETGAEMAGVTAVADGMVYVSGTEGTDEPYVSYVYALDAATGAERWRFQTGSRASALVVAGGVLYVGCGDRYVCALDAATGIEDWRFEAGGRAVSAAVTGGVLYVGAENGYVYAIGGSEGQQ